MVNKYIETTPEIVISQLQMLGHATVLVPNIVSGMLVAGHNIRRFLFQSIFPVCNMTQMERTKGIFLWHVNVYLFLKFSMFYLFIQCSFLCSLRNCLHFFNQIKISDFGHVFHGNIFSYEESLVS